MSRASQRGWLVLAATAGLFPVAFGCGDGGDVFVGRAVGAAGTGAASGFGGSASGAGGSGAAGADSGLCAGKPCANFRGSRDFVESDVGADTPGLFEAASSHPAGSDRGKEPAIVYPSHETMFPINVSRIRHEWSAPLPNALFRLRFVGDSTSVDVYTAKLDWVPSEEQWDWIAESNRGGVVRFSVFGLDPTSPTDAWESTAIQLYFSPAEVEGAIYYWSTGTKGVMKALVSDPIPLKFFTDPAAADAAACVACHTLSRDGKRMAVGYDGEKLREVSVPERERLLPVDSAVPARESAWTTFSPDGEQLLVAAGGKLTLIDSDTGDPIGPDAGLVPIPQGTVATHPDWSALGDRVAIALGTKGGNKDVEGGSIAVMSYDDGVWGAPEVLVSSSGPTDNNFFPVWSPDSRWLVYVNAAEKSKDAASATLWLISVDGGAPKMLTRINQRVNQMDGSIGIGNSMPTWAPSTRPGLFWIAFSSLRQYATLRPQDEQADQIWIAALDPSLPDPGYAAFWAPFQNLADGNHRAFWTHTDSDTQCGCQDRCGDGLDNDCDGVADEADCASCGPVEICGDGIDNNCDCVVDGCNLEICGDGLDNDGDGLTDVADPSCRVE